jgi:hypothetical protein
MDAFILVEDTGVAVVLPFFIIVLINFLNDCYETIRILLQQARIVCCTATDLNPLGYKTKQQQIQTKHFLFPLLFVAYLSY